MSYIMGSIIYIYIIQNENNYTTPGSPGEGRMGIMSILHPCLLTTLTSSPAPCPGSLAAGQSYPVITRSTALWPSHFLQDGLSYFLAEDGRLFSQTWG